MHHPAAPDICLGFDFSLLWKRLRRLTFPSSHTLVPMIILLGDTYIPPNEIVGSKHEPNLVNSTKLPSESFHPNVVTFQKAIQTIFT